MVTSNPVIDGDGTFQGSGTQDAVKNLIGLFSTADNVDVHSMQRLAPDADPSTPIWF